MKHITCIFFGKSGAGKGTQADLLLKYLAKHDPETPALYVETGAQFREFAKTSPTFTAEKVKEVMTSGGLMPAFLPIWTWTQFFIDRVTGKEHMVMDGLSRQPAEAPILDSALQFYGRKGTVVFLLDVHHTEAKKRLLARGRLDDKHHEIDKRLSWFDSHVMQAVSYFEKVPYYTFVRINGDQPVEKVHADIVKALGI